METFDFQIANDFTATSPCFQLPTSCPGHCLPADPQEWSAQSPEAWSCASQHPTDHEAPRMVFPAFGKTGFLLAKLAYFAGKATSFPGISPWLKNEHQGYWDDHPSSGFLFQYYLSRVGDHPSEWKPTYRRLAWAMAPYCYRPWSNQVIFRQLKNPSSQWPPNRK